VIYEPAKFVDYDWVPFVWEEIEGMPLGPNRAAAMAVEGLLTDGAHHKQWALEQVLKALGFDLIRIKGLIAEDQDGIWEKGIAP